MPNAVCFLGHFTGTSPERRQRLTYAFALHHQFCSSVVNKKYVKDMLKHTCKYM